MNWNNNMRQKQTETRLFDKYGQVFYGSDIHVAPASRNFVMSPLWDFCVGFFT